MNKGIDIDSLTRARIDDEPLMKYFKFQHLPEHLQFVSREFYYLAVFMVVNIPKQPERTVGLRKLLEAKDCAVRAALNNM